VQDPGGEKQEGICDQMKEIDDSKQGGWQAESSRCLPDMLLSKPDAIVPLAAVSRAQSERIFGLVDTLEDWGEEDVVRLRRIVRTSPPAARNRDRVRYLKPVDGDDVVTWTNARMPSVGTDRKADLREIVLVECDSGAASDNERAVLPA
jgi:hypothetical protein